MISSSGDETLTIEKLRAEGMRLGLVCGHCHRFRYLNDSRFADTETLGDIAKKLTCNRCRSTDVEAVAVSRDPKTGYWPAERS
ncbi:hypothetical protein [Roseibium aggregatum]|uniref:Uncharacterized protein n=1 Tax=Roseibium aggregatum TaxID=187304 RepID=A0A926S517_9HYPH|nr:hypothetical protein [Roseibium aggregatum]MBD1545991.1 hypothetical protein [Roseibium aggregatum]